MALYNLPNIPMIKKSVANIHMLYSCIAEAMKKTRIVPDVVLDPPLEEVSIIYPGRASVKLGCELRAKDVKDTPKVTFAGKEHMKYCLCMVDADVPSRANPINADWLHWLVGNMPNSDVENGETLAKYIGSMPGFGTGCHRYVYMVFQQPGSDDIDFTEVKQMWRPMSVKNRDKFSITQFAKRYKLGRPVFGNFFEAQYDDSVAHLIARLKDVNV